MQIHRVPTTQEKTESLPILPFPSDEPESNFNLHPLYSFTGLLTLWLSYTMNSWLSHLPILVGLSVFVLLICQKFLCMYDMEIISLKVINIFRGEGYVHSWLWWWLHRCTLMSKLIKCYTLNMCSLLYVNHTSIKLFKEESYIMSDFFSPSSLFSLNFVFLSWPVRSILIN